MAEGTPSKEINQVEPCRIVGGHREGGGLGEIVEVGRPSGLGRNSGIKVSLAPLT